jgi:hypothetical protein
MAGRSLRNLLMLYWKQSSFNFILKHFLVKRGRSSAARNKIFTDSFPEGGCTDYATHSPDHKHREHFQFVHMHRSLQIVASRNKTNISNLRKCILPLAARTQVLIQPAERMFANYSHQRQSYQFREVNVPWAIPMFEFRETLDTFQTLLFLLLLMAHRPLHSEGVSTTLFPCLMSWTGSKANEVLHNPLFHTGVKHGVSPELTEIVAVSEPSAEENIWTHERGSNWRRKLHEEELHNLHSSSNIISQWNQGGWDGDMQHAWVDTRNEKRDPRETGADEKIISNGP